MKRTFSTFLALCSVLLVTAGPISKQAARFTAQSYMLAKGKSLSSAPSPRRGAKASTSSQGEENEYYYVFNAGNDGGYVIISGDDRTEPILGYVEQGTFDPDNIPENMRSWLQSYTDQIKYIVENDIQPDSPLLKKRDKVRGTKHSVPEILTSRWNQGHPYNLTCPKYYKGDGTQDYPASGCVATAMAQVVNFYKYPARIKKAIPALTNTYTLDDGTTKTSTAKRVPVGRIIDWENMRDTYNCWDGHEHNVQDTAVANLMLYCGQAVKMGYGESSGAVTALARDVFVNIFGFDDSAVWEERSSHSIDEWFDMLYNEIAAGYPVLFNGYSSGGGHAFVLDGFDGDNLFHVNWGWGGGSNGWFLVGILNPGDNSGIGASSSSDGYSMGQGALFNLRLPDGVTAEPTTALTINDVEISGTEIKGNWINWTDEKGNFQAAIVKLDDDGTLSPVISLQSFDLDVNYYASITFPIENRLSEGTYKLSPASKLSTAKVWRTKYNMKNEYIEAVVDANGVPTMRFVTPTENISIESIEFPGTHIVNTQQEVKVTYRNNGDEYYREVLLYASKTDEKVYTESRSMIAVRKGETVEVSYFFTPSETGTYNLWFCTGWDGSGQVGQGTMEIVEEANGVKANLAVTAFTVNNVINGTAYGKRLVGKATIKNNAKTDFIGKVLLQTWSYRDGDEYVFTGPNQTVSLSIASGKTATVEFEFNDLSDGLTYYCPIYYVGQDGELTGAGMWDRSWKMASGIVTWTNKGVISGKAYTAALSGLSSVCGIYADCNNFNRVTPNANKNTIYAFASNMTLPASLDNYNTVSGNHAGSINLVNDKPYYVPVNFNADEATFTYTFPETERGAGWHTFTLPFTPTEITIDGNPVSLDSEDNHFWIYEFAAQGDEGEVIFAPATVLRGSTPYIIAADGKMAGKSLTFSATDASFYKTGSDKMIVSSQYYKFYGTTLAPTLKDCYILNADGTAFDYITTSKALTALNAYFTTPLSEELRLPSIVLPDVPLKSGDVNGDGEIDLSDAIMVTYCSLHEVPSSFHKFAADMNGDGEIDLSDAIIIIYMSLGVK